MDTISLIISVNGRNVNRVMLKKQKVTLGRDADNDIVLDDPAVSSKHAEILWQDEEGFMLIDLASTNGTLVNNQKIGEYALQHGDIISMGMTNLEIADSQNELKTTKAIKKSWLPGVYFLKDKK
ncbi:MAG: FHA domain-containing protein [Pseudomonadota bacterium]